MIQALAEAKNRLMLALDVDSREKAEEWVHRMKIHVGVFKVGLQLFTAAGSELVRSVRARGGRIFLDVKYHDIPTTVARACEAAVMLGVEFINVHALGGKAMISEAAKAIKSTSERMRRSPAKLLAVTILTSHEGRMLKKEVGLKGTPEKEVLRLAKLAKEAGADGVVCSPKEIRALRKACGKDFLIVCPGIRSGRGSKQDQKRTLPAGEAILRGADFLVVGRPITGAPDPVEAAREIAEDMARAIKKRAGRK